MGDIEVAAQSVTKIALSCATKNCLCNQVFNVFLVILFTCAKDQENKV